MRPAAQDYPDETGGGGIGSMGVSDEDVALSADERKRTKVGYGGIARHRSLWDDKRWRWAAVSAYSVLA